MSPAGTKRKRLPPNERHRSEVQKEKNTSYESNCCDLLPKLLTRFFSTASSSQKCSHLIQTLADDPYCSAACTVPSRHYNASLDIGTAITGTDDSAGAVSSSISIHRGGVVEMQQHSKKQARRVVTNKKNKKKQHNEIATSTPAILQDDSTANASAAAPADVLTIILVINQCISLLRDSNSSDNECLNTVAASLEAQSMDATAKLDVIIVISQCMHLLSTCLVQSDRSKLDKFASSNGGGTTATPAAALDLNNITSSTSTPTLSITSKTILMHALVSIVVGSMTSLVTLTQIVSMKGLEDPFLSRSPDRLHSAHVALWQILSSMEYVVSMSPPSALYGLSKNSIQTAPCIPENATSVRSSGTTPSWNFPGEQAPVFSNDLHSGHEDSEDGNVIDGHLSREVDNVTTAPVDVLAPPPSITYSSSMFSSAHWLQQLLVADSDDNNLHATTNISRMTSVLSRVERLLRTQFSEFYKVLQFRMQPATATTSDANTRPSGEECYCYIIPKYAMEARISYRRWASIILIHPCSGVSALLTAIQKMLDSNLLKDILGQFSLQNTGSTCVASAVVTKKRKVASESSSSPRRQTNKFSAAQNETLKSRIPGNVLRIVYTSKILDLLRHATSLVGHYPYGASTNNNVTYPKCSGMDMYAATLLGIKDPISRPRKSPFPIMNIMDPSTTMANARMGSASPVEASNMRPKRRSARSTRNNAMNNNEESNTKEKEIDLFAGAGLFGMQVMNALIIAHLDVIEENDAHLCANTDNGVTRKKTQIFFGSEFLVQNNATMDVHECLTFYCPFIIRTMVSLSMLVRDHSPPLTVNQRAAEVSTKSKFQDFNRELSTSLFFGIPAVHDLVLKNHNDWYSKLMVFGCAVAFSKFRKVTDGKLITLSLTLLLMALYDIRSDDAGGMIFRLFQTSDNALSLQSGEYYAVETLCCFLRAMDTDECISRTSKPGIFFKDGTHSIKLVLMLMSVIDSSYAELATPENRSNAVSKCYRNDSLIFMTRSALKVMRYILESLPLTLPSDSSTVPSTILVDSSFSLFDFTGSKNRLFNCWVETINHNCGIFNISQTYDAEAECRIRCASKESQSSFSLAERMLWSDHIKVCLAIGRGRVSHKYSPPFQISETNQSNIAKSVLIDSSTRLDAFKAIAKFLVKGNGHGARLRPSSWRWPLVMPVAYHAILLSNLSSERLGKEKEADPERFLVNAFILSLEDSSQKSDESSGLKGYVEISREHVFLLSDARLLVLAVSRLPREECVEKTRKIIFIFSNFISSIHSSDFSRVSSCDVSTSAISGFVSRLLIAISTLFDLLQAPRSCFLPIAMELAKAASRAHYHVPELDDIQKSYHDDECAWYTREQCFMGLFTDWECPFVPYPRPNAASDSGCEINCCEKLNIDDIRCFQRLLIHSLAFGFCTAPADKCLLTYSAWNAAAKARPLTVEGWWEGSPSDAIASCVEAEQCANSLFIIRDLVISLYCSLNPSSLVQQPGRHPKSLLRKTLWKYQQQNRSESTKPTLKDATETIEKHMLTSCRIIETQVQHLQLSSHTRTPPISLAQLNASVIYLSLLVAQHSIPEKDCIESMRNHDVKCHQASGKLPCDFGEGGIGKPKRRNTLSSAETHTTNMSHSNVEENVHSMGVYDQDTDDEEEDAKMDALARLNEACGSLGAAPVHPDWLDMTSRLRNGINPELAVQRGEQALTLLVTIGRLAHKKCQCLTERIIMSSNTCNNVSTRPATLAADILSTLHISRGEHSAVDETYQSERIENERQASNDFLSPYSNFDLEGLPTESAVKAKLAILFPHLSEGLYSKGEKATILNLTSEARSVWCSECSSHVIWGKFHTKFLDGSASDEDQDLSVPLYTGDVRCSETSSIEMRAAGEWEWMLGRNLSSGLFGDKDLDELQAEKEQWADTLWVVCDALVSACALLRIGWNNGRGRSSKHPLCSKVTDDLAQQSVRSGLSLTKEYLPLDCLTLEDAYVSSTTLSNTISSVLNLCAEICCDSSMTCQTRKSCHVACAHIIYEDPMEFLDLVGVYSVRRVIHALRRLNKVNGDLDIEAGDDQAGVCEKRLAIVQLSEWLLVWLDSVTGTSHDGALGDIGENFVASNFTSISDVNDNVQSSESCKISYCRPSSNPPMKIGPTNRHRLERLLYSLKIDTLGHHTPSRADTLPLCMIDVGQIISMLVAMLCDRKRFGLSLNSRVRLSRHLCGLVVSCTSQCKDDLVQNFSIAFSLLSEASLKEVVVGDVCLLTTNGLKNGDDKEIRMRVSLSRYLCFLFCHLVNYDSVSISVFENMYGHVNYLLDKWGKSPTSISSRYATQEECVLKLLFLLALRYDKLIHIGVVLLERGKDFVRTLQRPESAVVALPGLRLLEQFLGLLKLSHDLLARISTSSGGVDERKVHGEKNNPNKLSDELVLNTSIPPERLTLTSRDDGAVARMRVKFPKTCSYVETSGDFRSQHWYNCYTCGLVWEKGCCSLCAVVCHKGHDVGYSRKSSFFCDCGAGEVEDDNEQKNIKEATVTSCSSLLKKAHCRCLRPIAESQLKHLYHEARKCGGDGVLTVDRAMDKKFSQDPVEASSLNNEDASPPCGGELGNIPIPLEFIISSIASNAEISLQNFCTAAIHSNWTETVETLFLSYLKFWKSHCNCKASLYMHRCPENLIHGCIRLGEEEEAARSTLACVLSGKALLLQSLLSNSMIPVRATKAAAVNAKFSNDVSVERVQRAILAKHGLHRRIIVADNRGRLIIAEPCSLLFCAALPLINSRHVEKPLETPLDRSQLPILGSAKVKFAIVGVILHPENDQYLLVWGKEQACVLALNCSCDKVDKSIDLELDIAPDTDAECICQCDWVPGSEAMAAVVCGTFIKIFDTRKANPMRILGDKEFSARSTTSFTLAFEDVLIKAAVLIPVDKDQHASSVNRFRSKIRLVMLIETGRMYTSEWRLDANGNLEDQGETYLECGEGVRFPSEGIRRYAGAAPGHPGSTSTTLGDGSHLFYLKQSGLLLYKCVSAPLVAMKLNPETGFISSAFELLPHTISSETLGSGVDEYSISGPYTHVTELGIYQKQSDEQSLLTFRIACVGKSTRTNLPKLLCIDFNEGGVKVKELSWPTGMSSVGLGLSLTFSVEGVAAFSAPFLVGSGKGVEQGFVSNRGKFYERVCLAAVMSNGCLLFYGEDTTEICTTGLNEKADQFHRELLGATEFNDRILNESVLDDSKTGIPNSSTNIAWASNSFAVKKNEPMFPLQVFETLLNISEYDSLVFGGDGAGIDADSAKQKLLIGNGEFVVSPSREGCTFTLSLVTCRPQKYSKDDGKKKMKSGTGCDINASKYVIVAVRVLVGSAATETLPRHITLMGRPIKLVQGMKRWYDLPLTDEEIYLGVRSGCVSVVLGSCYDMSCTPAVDAIEAYVLERCQVKFLNSPTSDSATSSNFFFPNRQSAIISLDAESTEENKAESLHTFTLNAILKVVMKCMTNLFSVLHEYKPSESFEACRSNATKKALQSLLQMAMFSSSSKEIRLQVSHTLEQIEPDSINRQVIIDESVLMGVEDALRCIEEELKQELLLGVEIESNSNESSFNERQFLVLSVICKCIESSLPIARDRSKNYVRILMKKSSEGVPVYSVASHIREVLKHITFVFPEDSVKDRWTFLDVFPQNISKNALAEKYGEVMSLLLELSVFDMAAGMRQQQRRADKTPKFADFSLISELFGSHGEHVVKRCCCSIAKVGETMTRLTDEAFVVREGSLNHEFQNPIAYQCDGCELFPITSIRYTLDLEDIDLCEKCYQDGCKFAIGTNQQEAVKIEAKRLRLGRNRELTCSQIRKMRARPVEDMKEEQVEQARDRLVAGEILIDGFDGENINFGIENLQPLSLLSEELFDSVLRDALSIVFFQVKETNLDRVMVQMAPPVCGSSGANTILTLLIHLALMPCAEVLRMQRGKKLAEALTNKLSALSKHCIKNDLKEEEMKKAQVSIALAMRALTSLLFCEDIFFESGNNLDAVDESEDDTALNRASHKVCLNICCKVHGIPAVRRRWSRGVNKNRRFYVCGMPKKLRCDYFEWAAIDTIGASPRENHESDHERDLTHVTERSPHRAMELMLWTLFSRPSAEGLPPLQSLLCSLLQKILSSSNDLHSIFSDIENLPSHNNFPGTNFRGGVAAFEKYQDELLDGVLVSRAKLGWLGGKTGEEKYCPPQISPLDTSSSTIDNDVIDCFAQVTLDLLSRLANSLENETKETYESWSSGWFPLLCEIISTVKSSSPLYASRAKVMLRKLCGCHKVAYHRVRDHYVFAFQFRKLLYYCRGPLQAALDVRERALCFWSGHENKTTLNALGAGDLLGVNRLVSEDSLAVDASEKLHQALNELTNSVLSRPSNWRKFCALTKLPQWQRGKVDYPIEDESEIDRSPIVLLLWMACSMHRATNQVSLLRLINVALTPDEEKMFHLNVPRELLNDVEASKNVAPTSSVHSLDSDTSGLDRWIASLVDGHVSSSPESVLLNFDGSLSINNIFSFVMEFVLHGRSSDVRIVSGEIAQVLISQIAENDLTTLILRFVGTPVTEVGPLGATSTEYFQFLCSILSKSTLNNGVKIIYSVVDSFINQNYVCCGLFIDSGTAELEADGVRKYFDLSSCIHCHKLETESAKGRKIESIHSNEVGEKLFLEPISESTTQSGMGASGGEKLVQNLPEQIRGYNRFRLDSCSLRVVCTEFATYVQLKSRLALSEINLNVSDPRGRFVKTVAIFFSPRTVGEVNDLKSAEYSHIWQRCGTLSLTKGSSRASCTLKSASIAANLKFEYQEFYEKAGGARTSSGLVCPRCTRQVNNAHGVCGSCGEVAFQCRKCRHINYDKLDAFFCVECGHCSSGSQFTYEVSAGLASNAISILDDVDFERAVNLMRMAMKRHGEARSALRKRLLGHSGEKHVTTENIESLDDIDDDPPALKRALLGEIPKYSSTGRGGGDSSVSSTSVDRSSLPALNRTRSLISLARQLRSEGSDRPTEHLRALIASIGSGIELFDDGYFGCGGGGPVNSLEANILQSEMPYPLSRLVANIQRVRDGTSGNASDATLRRESSRKRQLHEASGQECANESGVAARSSKTVLEECERLHRQLREAEKECFELHSCIAAWQRLNNGVLAFSDPAKSTASFVPSTCSFCAPKIAASLLHLLLAIFDKSKVDFVLSKNFVNALLDPSFLTNEELSKLKRKVVVVITSTSAKVALVVLDELRNRLLLSTKDAACAEILGLLLKEDFPLVGKFVELAMEIMASCC